MLDRSTDRRALLGVSPVPCAASAILGGRCEHDARTVAHLYDERRYGPGGTVAVPACAACADAIALIPSTDRQYVARVDDGPTGEPELDRAIVADALRFARGHAEGVHATGTYYIAPAAAPDDEWACGYDGNVFTSADEAEAEIHALAAALGGEPTDYVVCRRGGADALRFARGDA
jgi:hypothetical protein